MKPVCPKCFSSCIVAPISFTENVEFSEIESGGHGFWADEYETHYSVYIPPSQSSMSPETFIKMVKEQQPDITCQDCGHTAPFSQFFTEETN